MHFNVMVTVSMIILASCSIQNVALFFYVKEKNVCMLPSKCNYFVFIHCDKCYVQWQYIGLFLYKL